ncbi:MAG TPA: hypothetical protein VFO08_01950 [Methylomirabilota bacterium]|nr:hypothetical protein [Methylomirabilota bacterium]
MDADVPRHFGAGAHRWWGVSAFLVVLISVGPARAEQAVDCSERFPVGLFALTQNDAALLSGRLSGFSVVHILKKPLPMRSSGPEDPCELVYGVDVFEFTPATTAGALIAGCAGDFRGNGSRDYVVLLRRDSDGRYVPQVFLARDRAFDVVDLEWYAADDSAWFGPFCQTRPQAGTFQAPDFEGTGDSVRIPVVGDLFTVGWWTYYWRPDLDRFDAILTTD